MPVKKLFTVDPDTSNGLIAELRLCDTQWKQLCLCYEHISLSTFTTADGSCTNLDTSILTTQGQQRVASAAVVGPSTHQLSSIEQLRAADRTLFIICWHPDATEDPIMRWHAFHLGANMVTYCTTALTIALQQVDQQQQQHHDVQQQLPMPGIAATKKNSAPAILPDASIPNTASSSSSSSSSRNRAGELGLCTCDWCRLPNLSAAEYWLHQQLYHINHPNKPGKCQVCGRLCDNLARHLHDRHDPTGKPTEHRTGVFALAVIRRPSDGKLLMVQEFAGSGYWLPGGGVDQGETLSQGAIRECREEAGVEVELRGILDVEWQQDQQWRRVIFWGEPATTTAASCNNKTAVDTTSNLNTSSSSSNTDGSNAGPELSSNSSPCCSPKTLPNWESAGACWVDVSQLQQLPLRSASEPLKWYPVVAGKVEQLPRGLELPAKCIHVFQGFI